MISWIQNILAKNGKWVFSILIVVLLIPFVFTIGNTPGCVGTPQINREATFLGHDFSQRETAQRWSVDAQLSTLFETGRPPFNEQFLQMVMISRLTSLHLADIFDIPQPTAREIASMVKTLPFFQNENGSFNNNAYVEFLDNLENNPSLSEAQVERTLANSFRIKQIESVLMGQGYALPSEAIMAERAENATYTFQVARFNRVFFDPEIEVTEQKLLNHYQNTALNYQEPKKFEPAIVRFPIENFRDESQIEVTEDTLVVFLEQNKNLYLDSEGVLPDFESIRDRVATDYKTQESTRLATLTAEAQASELAYALYELNSKFNTAPFLALINEKGLALEELPAVSERDRPIRLGPNMPDNAIATVTALTADRYFSDPIRLTNGDYAIFFLRNTIPANTPAFEEVRARVEGDFRRTERDRLFAEEGAQITQQLRAATEKGIPLERAVLSTRLPRPISNLVDQFLNGRNLEYLAANDGSRVQRYEGVKVGSPPPSGLVANIVNQLPRLQPGVVSDMITQGGIGFFILINEKNYPEVDPEQVALGARIQNLKALSGSNLGQGIISEIIERDTARR